VPARLDFSRVTFEVTREKCAGCFELRFIYGSAKKSFRWQADLSRDESQFEGDLGAGRTTVSLGAHLLAPEQALSEAMFF
jgi:hypothetical protein